MMSPVDFFSRWVPRKVKLAEGNLPVDREVA